MKTNKIWIGKQSYIFCNRWGMEIEYVRDICDPVYGLGVLAENGVILCFGG